MDDRQCATQKPDEQTREWTVEGLDCADCAMTLAKDIEKLPGVISSSVSFATSKLKVRYDPKGFDELQIDHELKRLGYRVGGPKRGARVAVVIDGMDCADESTIIEKQLKRLPGVKNLQFNLVAQEVMVEYEPGILQPGRIIDEVDRTGMKGRLKGEEERPESFWERRRHIILTGLSGLFILAAFLFSRAGYPHKVTDPLYIAAIIAGGYLTARKGMAALRTFSLDINFLMSVAVIGAAFIEEWLEGATVLFLFSVANILQNHTMNRARNAIRSLMDLSPNEVTVERNGSEEKVATGEVAIGERIVVRPGEKIALDGRVAGGMSFVNQAPITGESMPVEKRSGDTVFAGTINGNGLLEIDVTRAYEDTTLAKIIHMVEEAQAQKAPSQSFIERFSRYYTPIVIGGAALVAIAPPLVLGAEFGSWLYRALVLLIISCPCALVISTPVSIVSGLTAAARRGILVKGGVYLEEAGSWKVITFDKTGTLTQGTPTVTDVIALNEGSQENLLRIAAAIEDRSEHHLAHAILEEARQRNVTYPKATDFEAISGKGAKATVDGDIYYIGSHRLCEELGMCNLTIDARMKEFERDGKTAVILVHKDRVIGIIGVADEVRKESAVTIDELKRGGVEKVIMLTGDNNGTAEAIASSLSVDEYYAELMPEDKSRIIKELIERYGKVAMVGDGVNDAPALAAASAGIAMGAAGTDTALETADIALMADDLSKLPSFIRLSRRTLSVIKQNISFSLVVKGVFIVLAMSGMATLWMAVAADMGASLAVIFNGLRLLAMTESS